MNDTNMSPQGAAAKVMVGKVWDAQIEMFEVSGSADALPDFVMPLRWTELPEHLKQQAALLVAPGVRHINTVMADLSKRARAESS